MSTFEQITSIKDERVVAARELASAAGRERTRKCLLEGEEILKWALAANVPIEQVFFHAKIGEHPLLTRLLAAQIPCYAVTDGILKKISETTYLIPFLGVGNIAHILSKPTPLQDFVVLLDDVRDYGNLGTILRTARAFGIRDILTTAPQTDLWYKKVVEASRGKVFDIRLQRFSSPEAACAELHRQGFQIVATSSRAPTLQSVARLQPKPIALVVGNETDGVCDAVFSQADLVVQIPMSGQVESLNVGVATGISVYELKLKLVIAMLTNYIRSTLGRDVNVAGKLIQQALDARLRSVSAFNSAQVIFLMVLKCDQTMTIEQVGKDMAMFGDELRTLLDPLLTEGLIYEESGLLRLTEKGELLLGQLWGIVESTEDELLQGFSTDERQQFRDFLRRLHRNCIRLMTPQA